MAASPSPPPRLAVPQTEVPGAALPCAGSACPGVPHQFGKCVWGEPPPPNPKQAFPGADRPRELSHHGCLSLNAAGFSLHRRQPKKKKKTQKTQISQFHPPIPPCQEGSRALSGRRAPTPAACRRAGSPHPLQAGKTFP